MGDRSYAPREVAIRGEAIYRERIHKLVDPVTEDSFVVIDVETGEYEVDASDAAATRRLLDRRPDAMTYAVRAGHLAAYSHLGGSGRPGPMKRENTGGDQQLRITLEIINAEGRPCPVEMVLDTGFSGYLTLPTETIRELGLSPLGWRTLELDGVSLSEFEAYLAAVSLQGHLTDVLALRSDGAPLMGMGLPWGDRIALHAIAAEEINIQELQAGAPENGFNASSIKRLFGSLWRSVKDSLFKVAVVVAAIAMFVAVVFGVISLPLDFGEILTFMGIWLALGVLLGQNRPHSMSLRQYLSRRGIGFLCCYVFFVVIVIAYVDRDEGASQVVIGDEFWGLVVLSVVSFAAGFFAGQDKEEKR